MIIYRTIWDSLEFSCKVGKHSSTDYYAVVTSFMDIWIAVSVFPQVPISRAHSFLRKILPNSATHRSKIVQILRLATASHLWLKTERAVQKLQLLKAGIVLSYVSNIKSKSFFSFWKCKWTWVDWNEWLMTDVWNVRHSEPKCFKFNWTTKVFWHK